MRTSRRGVTLIELLMVVSLMGIVAAMAVPRMRTGSDRANLSSARDIVATYANNARRAAITRGQASRLRLVGDTMVMVVTDNQTSPNDTVIARASLRGQYRSTVTLDGAAGGAISFDKRGLLRGAGGTRKLLITNADGVRDSVCVSGAGLVMRRTCR